MEEYRQIDGKILRRYSPGSPVATRLRIFRLRCEADRIPGNPRAAAVSAQGGGIT